MMTNSIPRSWLNEEKWRLRTFATYPYSAAKSAIMLAQNGFYYNGSGVNTDDSVICYFCTGSKRGWRVEENIEDIHRLLSPVCPMVTGATSNNVAISASKGGMFAFGRFQSYGIETSREHGSGTNPGLGAVSMISSSLLSGPESSSLTQIAQGQSPNRPNQPQRSVQMASMTTMSLAAPLRQSNLAATQSQAQEDTFNALQPSDESGASSTVTSNNIGTTITPPTGSSGSTGRGSSSGSNNVPEHTRPNPPSTSANVSTASNIQTSTTVTTNQPGPVPQTTQSSNPTSTCSVPVNQPTNQPTTQPTNQSNTSNAPDNQTNPPTNPKNPTYFQLGIITERPKRFEYAVLQKRLETFRDWPEDHHLRKEDLANAGFYYAGYGDCARCFYCGGGLRNWEAGDDVWVEHARWFPKCAFMRQKVGQAFIDTVADFAKDYETIPYKMVVDKMGIDEAAFQIDNKDTPLKSDPAVLTMRELGYQESDIIAAATLFKEINQVLSADELLDSLETRGAVRGPTQNHVFNSIGPSSDPQRDREILDAIKKSNSEMRLQYLCKICLDKEVAVVFLPCGHLVCCTECSTAMRDCPICRKNVKGFVRGFMG